MNHTPEEYGQYWSGAIRVAAGLFFMVLSYRLVLPLLESRVFMERALAYFVLAGAILVGSVALVLGTAVVVKTAVANAR